MNHLRITIAVTEESIQEILIAWLSELGYEGFVQLEDALQAYLPEADFDAEALEELLLQKNLAYTTDLLPDKNWNEEWERNFTPVSVDDFCAVRAQFHDPVPGVRYDLVITPKMSFGTGHHATTYMMLRAMQDIDFKDRVVLDFGTGTGVLAILAEKLLASTILAADNDDWSIDNAQENFRENNCTRITLAKLDHLPAEPEFDIILSNINKSILLRELSNMAQQLKNGGVILLSGLLREDSEDIENEAAICGLSISERMTRGTWICLRMRKG